MIVEESIFSIISKMDKKDIVLLWIRLEYVGLYKSL